MKGGHDTVETKREKAGFGLTTTIGIKRTRYSQAPAFGIANV